MEPNDLDPEVLELASKIFDLARTGDAATLAAYLDAGVPVNLTNDNGDTLLMLAAYYSHPEAVNTLLERKADPNFGNDKGQTPLSGAVFKGSDEIVQALLAAGADPNAGSPSARDAAEMFGQTKYLKLFDQ
ncbi:ankyrin repeat domain-containing protein [Nocardia sp. CDC160]|uniref:ankyrin repeat domain-containing protein n=1 Tax=Nocardia sp. CDC160 TaxID=3112166 RepID=UPI002DB8743D|nr:ankyrin repeat domain-containing protein [Nocardia sp. CDC160]MEC3914870.1 ankyrin repeat domain-containing protein [Nocardia sp. CDC160]